VRQERAFYEAAPRTTDAGLTGGAWLRLELTSREAFAALSPDGANWRRLGELGGQLRMPDGNGAPFPVHPVHDQESEGGSVGHDQHLGSW
jgi:hypothetical protein